MDMAFALLAPFYSSATVPELGVFVWNKGQYGTCLFSTQQVMTSLCFKITRKTYQKASGRLLAC